MTAPDTDTLVGLLPCPFCGQSNVEIFGPVGWDRKYGVTHSCRVFYGGAGDFTIGGRSREDAIAAWNTRQVHASEPVAWTGSGSMMALRDGREGFIWSTKADSHPIPLYAHPVQEPPNHGVTTGATGAENHPPFEFHRYINGQLMAEGVRIEKQATLEGAMVAAAKIASRGPNGEAPVLVLATRAPVVPAEGLVAAIREAIDLLAERKHGSPARSPGHNARLVLEAALRSAPPVGARVKPLVDAIIRDLLVRHESQMRALGRNPIDYISKWSQAANVLDFLRDSPDLEARILAALLPAGEGE